MLKGQFPYQNRRWEFICNFFHKDSLVLKIGIFLPQDQIFERKHHFEIMILKLLKTTSKMPLCLQLIHYICSVNTGKLHIFPIHQLFHLAFLLKKKNLEVCHIDKQIHRWRTFVTINGVSKSLPPTNRNPHGVFGPSRCSITENSCNFGAIFGQKKPAPSNLKKWAK